MPRQVDPPSNSNPARLCGQAHAEGTTDTRACGGGVSKARPVRTGQGSGQGALRGFPEGR